MSQQLRDEQTKMMVSALLVISTIAVAFALQYTRGFMIPFVLSAFIATMVSPLVDFQLRHRVPRVIAIISTILVVLALLGVTAYFTVQAVQTIFSTAEEYSQNFVDMSDKAIAWLKEANIQIDRTEIEHDLQGFLISLAPRTASIAMGTLSNCALIVIFVVFLLAGRDGAQKSVPVYDEIESKIRGYVATKLLLSGATGILVGVILSILGLRMAPVFGMMAFFLNFIPSLGSVIATILPIPIAVAQYSNPFMWALVVLLPGAVQMGIGNVLEPKLMGKGMKLHPVVILLALAFWGQLWGVLGMVLSVPIMAAIRIILMEFQTTRAVGALLAGELPTIDTSD